MINFLKLTLMVGFTLFIGLPTLAKTVRYELTVENKPVNLSGKKKVDFALMVNGSIPAPTLEFTEGDDAEILVRNKLPKEEVSIHWHGILLPPEEDGVAYINTPPIFPGKERLFKFKIRQNGTFWYHSHTAVQEQKGVYGAFIIHPQKKPIAYDKDAVLVISDWSDENADQIIRNLRKDGDYYLYKKDSIRSYFGAIQAGGLKSHLVNEWSRMGGMDLSDVGYDAFLINGKRDHQLLVAHPGEKIRLRIINAGASSYFYVSMGVPMQVISADGVDIEPVMTNEILMGMAETYDVLFTVPEHKNYEIRATVQDVTGFASAWIGMGEKVPASNKPSPDLYAPMNHETVLSSNHSGHSEAKGAHNDHDSHKGHEAHGGHAVHHGHNSHNDHSSHGEHGKPEVVKPQAEAGGHNHHHGHHDEVKMKEMVPPSVKKYSGSIDWSSQSDAMLRQNSSHPRNLKSSENVLETLGVESLRALEPTTLPKEANVHDLKLVLGGDMERYVWHINGKAIYEDRLLFVDQGEVVRITFVNDTMMHHPMHLHGHFFRVLNKAGDKSPLKHTVDVPPHGSRTIEFFANEPGQWMLHCHNLYHMKTGMARVIRYRDYKLTPDMEKNDHHDPHLHQHLYTHTQLEAASNHAKARFRVMRTWDEIDLEIETASVDRENFSFGETWENEGDFLYRRWFSNYLQIFGGGTLYHENGYGIIGVGYVLPMLVESSISVNHKGKFRLDLEKRFQWTKNIFSDVEWTWRPNWNKDDDGDRESESEFEISLMYGSSWSWAAGFMFTDKSAGIGAQIQF